MIVGMHTRGMGGIFDTVENLAKQELQKVAGGAGAAAAASAAPVVQAKIRGEVNRALLIGGIGVVALIAATIATVVVLKKRRKL